jgi:small subunit ribosomal protein S18
MVTIAIKRARAAAIIPYTVTRKAVINNPFENIK